MSTVVAEPTSPELAPVSEKATVSIKLASAQDVLHYFAELYTNACLQWHRFMRYTPTHQSAFTRCYRQLQAIQRTSGLDDTSKLREMTIELIGLFVHVLQENMPEAVAKLLPLIKQLDQNNSSATISYSRRPDRVGFSVTGSYSLFSTKAASTLPNSFAILGLSLSPEAKNKLFKRCQLKAESYKQPLASKYADATAELHIASAKPRKIS
ncbi:MAG: hypothetical protein A3E87_07980 [Gammaproteobacteria bacterium RIFCSPHIGHO2_12_FULL_35_23]|nr:MAG: hypothetical protein A3E87_07980 [Gammaproteobacteria bacterium RIFCSPHIGHO2_12_FULL_35_23]